MGLKRKDVYKLIDGERDYQDKHWPQGSEALRIGEAVLLLEDYIHQARTVWTNERAPEVKTTAMIRKIAAIAVRTMEQHGAPPRIEIEDKK